jgi:hypothetical protein
LALLLGATVCSSVAYLFLNVERIPFSPTVVYRIQPLIVPGIVALTRKIAAENREKMKPQALFRIDGSWNHRRNGSANIPDMVDFGSRRVVDCEIPAKILTSNPKLLVRRR